MNTQIRPLSDHALDAVSGGLAISAATAPGRYGTKLPPLPDSSPGNQGDNSMGALTAGLIVTVGLFGILA